MSDALDIVHELACLDRIDAVAAGRDGGLAALARWRGRALDTVAELVFSQHERLDGLFPTPLVAALARVGLDGRGAVPDFAWGSERDLDPRVPSNAIRIVLDLAPDGVLESGECNGDPALLAGSARQRGALGLVRLFVAIHGEALDAALSDETTTTSDPPASPRAPVRCRAVLRRDPASSNVVSVSFRPERTRTDAAR